jgi:hypothetical protein
MEGEVEQQCRLVLAYADHEFLRVQVVLEHIVQHLGDMVVIAFAKDALDCETLQRQHHSALLTGGIAEHEEEGKLLYYT